MNKNKLIFTVDGPRDNDIVNLIKEIIKIKCKINLDLSNGLVTVEDVTYSQIDDVIDLIDKYYILLNVEINTISESTPVSSLSDVNTEIEDDTVNVPAFSSTVSEQPLSASELAIKKVEFQNPNVEKAINKLLQTTYWALYKHNESEKEIVDHIWTVIKEMSLKFNPTPLLDFKIGDVVDCYFGRHLPKELNGSHVLGIIANISKDNMVFLIPVTKMTTDIAAESYLQFEAPNDVVFEENDITAGTVIFDGSKYIRAERIQKVLGKVNDDFMKKIISQLAQTFDFKESFQRSDISVDSTQNEITSNNGEIILGTIVDFALKNIKKQSSIKTNVYRFLKDIGMEHDNPVVINAFIASCNISKITYENVFEYINNMENQTLNENEVTLILKNTFKNWLSSKKELENYQRLAFTSLLKIFAKAIRE